MTTQADDDKDDDEFWERVMIHLDLCTGDQLVETQEGEQFDGDFLLPALNEVFADLNEQCPGTTAPLGTPRPVLDRETAARLTAEVMALIGNPLDEAGHEFMRTVLGKLDADTDPSPSGLIAKREQIDWFSERIVLPPALRGMTSMEMMARADDLRLVFDALTACLANPDLQPLKGAAALLNERRQLFTVGVDDLSEEDQMKLVAIDDELQLGLMRA